MAMFCKSCHVCQMTGKLNQVPQVAPLVPIPVMNEPFSRVIVDCVRPLPKTRNGNKYLLTVMCTSTRFPEAIPLRNIKAPNIVKGLIKFFKLVGLPNPFNRIKDQIFYQVYFSRLCMSLELNNILQVLTTLNPREH